MDYKSNAFPLKKGQVNLTSGTYGGGVYLAVKDGSLTVTWDDATTSVITVEAGLAVQAVFGVTSVAITTGTFHLG